MNLTRAVKRKLRAGLIPVVLVLWLAGFARLNAAFEETSVSGRAAGLGGIYVSACDDASSIYHNPAGLAFMDRAEFTAQYSRLYIGLSDNSNLGYSFLGVAQPLGSDAGTLGIGWLRFELTGLYSEDTMMISYARDGSFLNKSWANKVTFGANLKYLRLSYGQDPYSLNALDNFGNASGARDSLFAHYGTSKDNMDADIGMQYRIGDNYKIGMMIENLTEPNLALQPGVSAPLWRTYKLGITHTGKSYLALVDFMFKKFNDTTDWEVAPAGEKWVSKSVALRGSLNIGSRELVNVSCGVGYKIDNFQIDYAMIYPLSGIQGTIGDQRISFLFRFGPVIHLADASEKMMKKYNEEKQAHAFTKKKLQEANAELEKLRSEMELQLSMPAPVVPVSKKIHSAALAPSTTAHAQAPAIAPKPEAAQKVSADSTAQYLKELNQYRATAQELTIPQRLAKIDAIIKKYRSELNLSEAQQERAVLINEQKAQGKYFKDSLDYYRSMAKYGIKKEEKMDILKRMISKYKGMGIDISEAQKEIDKIEGN